MTKPKGSRPQRAKVAVSFTLEVSPAAWAGLIDCGVLDAVALAIEAKKRAQQYLWDAGERGKKILDERAAQEKEAAAKIAELEAEIERLKAGVTLAPTIPDPEGVEIGDELDGDVDDEGEEV